MLTLGPLVPLILTCAILLGGNGLQGSLVALKAEHVGFSVTIVGLTGTTYFAGFLAGCVLSPKLIQAVGHIRVFAALASISASMMLALVLLVDPWAWLIIRFVTGFCMCGLFTVIESWLNASAGNTHRARIVALYRTVDLLSVTGAQFLLPIFGVNSFHLFALMAILFACSTVPVALVDRTNPRAPQDFRFDLGFLWRLSPLACMTSLVTGLANSVFRLIGPLYATASGLDIKGVAIFITTGIVGAAAAQFPLGYLSDRFGRRVTVLGCATIGSCAGLFLAFVAGSDPTLIFTGIALFGAFALPLYSLAASHANDQVKDPEGYVLVAAGLTFFFSIGAIAGPFLAATFLASFGPPAVFAYTAVIHGALVVVTVWRLRVNPLPWVSRTGKGIYGRITSLLRTPRSPDETMASPGVVMTSDPTTPAATSGLEK